MTSSQVKRVLQEAAKLPPAKARRVVDALASKAEDIKAAAKIKTAEDLLTTAQDAMVAAMLAAVIADLPPLSKP